jgi:two-component system OmpR family response regulator
MVKLLLVEDDRLLAETIVEYLSKAGFQIVHASDGRSGMALAISTKFDVVILDVTLPHLSGFEICRRLRKDKIETPLLFLTSKTHVSEIVNGLQLGADAYMTKPFQLLELKARLEGLINRPPTSRDQQVLIAGTIRVNYDQMTVERDEINIFLRHKEFAILRLLLQCHMRVLTREYILDHTGDSDAFAATIDVHVSRLRKSLGLVDGKSVIETVHGSGYRVSLPLS